MTYEEFRSALRHLSDAGRRSFISSLTFEQLNATDKNGWTTAHLLAGKGYFPREFLTEKILRISNEKKGVAVAHWLASGGYLSRELMTDEILGISDKEGVTVAHSLASAGFFPPDLLTREILLSVDKGGNSVACFMASSLTLPQEWMTSEILKLTTDRGLTVAHILAMKSSPPAVWMTPDILLLRTPDGQQVLDLVMIQLVLAEQWKYLDPHLLFLKQGSGTPVVSWITKQLLTLSETKLDEAIRNIPEESLTAIFFHTKRRKLKQTIDDFLNLRQKIAEREILEKTSEKLSDEDTPDFY